MDSIVEKPGSAGNPSVPDPSLRKKIFVATPCYGCQLTIQFATSLIRLQIEAAKRGVELHIEFIGNESLVERARNILTAKFLRTDATHLLFIDADIEFHPNTVFRLLDFDKDVTSAVYPKKAIDWNTVKNKIIAGDNEDVRQMGLDFNINATRSGALENGFMQVLDTATGFLMIKRGVIERMCEHYREELFAVNDLAGHDLRDYIALFACMIDPVTKRFLSEDYSFCRRWQAIGGDIWACLATTLGHTGTHHYTGDVRHRVNVA